MKNENEKKEREVFVRIYDQERLLKFWHSKMGRLDRNEGRARASAKQLSSDHGRARVIDIEMSHLSELSARWQLSVDPMGDYIEQLKPLLDMATTDSGVSVYPSIKTLKGPQFLHAAAWRLLLPSKHCVVFLVTEAKQVFTSLIVRKKGQALDLVTTSEAFFKDTPKEVTPNWVKELVKLTEKSFGPVHCAMGADRAALRSYLDKPSSLGKLEKSGAIVRPRWPWAWNVLLWAVKKRPKKSL